MRIAAVTAAALAFALAPASPAGAAFPGVNGPVAFESNRDGNVNVYVAEPDGSGQRGLTTDVAVGHDRDPAVSSDGRTLAFASDREQSFDLYLLGDAGLRRLTSHPAAERRPAWAPDGSRLAFETDRDGNLEIYAIGADGSGERNLTNHPAHDADPAWSPDGSRIAFASLRDGNAEIYVMNADGSNVRRVTNDPGFDEQPNWSPDGTRIALTHTSAGQSADVAVIGVDGSGGRVLAGHPEVDEAPAWSPDGSRIAFGSNRHGGFGLDLYTMASDGSDVRPLVAVPSGTDTAPDWAPRAAAPIGMPGPAPPGPVPPAPAPGPAPPGGAVRAGPSISGLVVTPSRPRASGRVTVRFRLSAPARLAIAVELRTAGRYRRLATLRRSGRAGVNRITLPRRIRGRGLRPGRYRLALTATDSAGVRSPTARIGFTLR